MNYYEAVSDCSKWQEIYAQLDSGSYLANVVTVLLLLLLLLLLLPSFCFTGYLHST